MSDKTFMDWEPNQDWTAFKAQDAASSPNMKVDTVNTDWWSFDANTNLPKVNNTYGTNIKTNTNNTGFDFSTAFNGKNIGGTLQGIGAIGGALASIYGVSEQKRFNEDMLDMEKTRVKKEYEKRDKQQSEYDAVWKSQEQK